MMSSPCLRMGLSCRTRVYVRSFSGNFATGNSAALPSGHCFRQPTRNLYSGRGNKRYPPPGWMGHEVESAVRKQLEPPVQSPARGVLVGLLAAVGSILVVGAVGFNYLDYIHNEDPLWNQGKLFLPIYMWRTKKRPSRLELDEDSVRVMLEAKLLEKLSVNSLMKDLFGLPIFLDSRSMRNLEITVEEIDPSFWGLTFSRNGPSYVKFERRKIDSIKSAIGKLRPPLSLKELKATGNARPSVADLLNKPSYHEIPAPISLDKKERDGEYIIVVKGEIDVSNAKQKSAAELPGQFTDSPKDLLLRNIEGAVQFEAVLDNEHRKHLDVTKMVLKLKRNDGGYESFVLL